MWDTQTIRERGLPFYVSHQLQFGTRCRFSIGEGAWERRRRSPGERRRRDWATSADRRECSAVSTARVSLLRMRPSLYRVRRGASRPQVIIIIITIITLIIGIIIIITIIIIIIPGTVKARA